jgi:hypothetical protein
MLQPIRNSQRAQKAYGAFVPSPTGGWDAVSPLSSMKPDRAPVLDNWVPRPDTVEVRKGYTSHALGMGSGVVDSLMPYNAVTTAGNKLFAAAGGSIYDATSVATATDVLTALGNNRWQHVNFTAAGGTKYLVICNGQDSARAFDGSSWSTPSISGGTSSTFINVTAHKDRLWYVEKDTTKAWYLNTGSISGTATSVQLGPAFTKGGFLVAAATMTRDGGSGSDDFLCFISSQGQCAVYSGTDPSSSTTWSQVGVFDLGAPIGYRCFTKVGADLALINIDGVLPVSAALGLDISAQKQVAMSVNINDAMNTAAQSYKSNFGWQLISYPKGTLAILNVPITAGVLQYQYVMNTITKAWCRFKGMNANCWAIFNDNLYFGGNAGVVYRADNGGTDGGTAIDAEGQTAYNYFGDRARTKLYLGLQPLITTDSSSRPALGVSTDFKDNATLGTPSAVTSSSALYDSAVYDTDVYAQEDRSISDWTSVAGMGRCASVHFRASKNSTSDATMELNGFNMIFQRGGSM